MQNRGNKHKGANRGQSGISPDHRSERCRSTVMRQINLVWHQQSVRGLLATGERERKTDADATGKAFELFPSLIRRSFLPPAPRSVRPSLRPSDREGRRSLCGCSPCSVSSVRPSRSSAISHQLLESANPSRIEASFRALLAAQAQLEVECELTTCNPESIHWFNKRIEKLLWCSFCDHHSPDPVNSSICAFKLGIPSRNYDLRTTGCVN